MQELARDINYWSVGISHVHWTRQFKLSRTRQYMPLYLGLRIIVEHRVDVKWTCRVETYEQCFCVLSDGSSLCPVCTGDRLQKRVWCVLQSALVEPT